MGTKKHYEDMFGDATPSTTRTVMPSTIPVALSTTATTATSMLSNSGAMRQASSVPRLIITMITLAVALVLTFRQLKD